MIANIVVSSVGAFTVKVFNRGTGTQVGSAITPAAVGSSTTRWTVNLGSLADGQYDLEHGDGYGTWALVVIGAVATVYSSWEAYSPPNGSGTYTITIHVKDSATLVSIPNALVSVQRSGAPIVWAFTDAVGNAVFVLNAATYSFNVSMFGYAAAAAVPLVVTANATTEQTLVAVSVAPPSVPNLCSIAFNVLKPNGDPAPGVIISMRLLNELVRAPVSLVTQQTTKGITDSNGQLTLIVIQSSVLSDGRYELLIVDPLASNEQFRRIVSVPTTLSCSADTLTYLEPL